MRERLELAEDAEVARLLEARDRAMQQKSAQMEQLDCVRSKILEERAANRAEVRPHRRSAHACSCPHPPPCISPPREAPQWPHICSCHSAMLLYAAPMLLWEAQDCHSYGMLSQLPAHSTATAASA
jgi:hypothetical protein